MRVLCVSSRPWPRLAVNRDALDDSCSVRGRRCTEWILELSITSSVCFPVFKVSIEIKPTQAPGWRTGQDKAHTITLLPYNILDPGGVEHDAAAAAHRLGGQVARELGANGAPGKTRGEEARVRKLHQGK
jgi:hypothetical protein